MLNLKKLILDWTGFCKVSNSSSPHSSPSAHECDPFMSYQPNPISFNPFQILRPSLARAGNMIMAVVCLFLMMSPLPAFAGPGPCIVDAGDATLVECTGDHTLGIASGALVRPVQAENNQNPGLDGVLR